MDSKTSVLAELLGNRSEAATLSAETLQKNSRRSKNTNTEKGGGGGKKVEEGYRIPTAVATLPEQARIVCGKSFFKNCESFFFSKL